MAAFGGGADLTTIDSILKEFYLPPVVEQLNNEVLLLQRLEARDEELYGRIAVVPLHTSRSGAIGARGEGILLPSAGNQVYAKATFDLKFLYGRFAVTGPAMIKSSQDSGAFLRALQGELDGMRNDLKKDLARQVYGNGDGIIANCASFGASTTVTLTTDEALRKGDIYVGMRVDIGTLAAPSTLVDGSVGTNGTVSSVNIAAKTFVITSSITTVAGTHFVFRQGSSPTSATTYEVSGLQQIVATAATSFGNINPASAGNGYWDNLRMTNSGTARSLSLDLMQQAYGQQRINGGELSSIITSFGVQRAYFNLLQSQVRYNEPMTLKGGFSSLDFMGQPLIADIQAPYGKMYFLDEKYLKVFSDRDWHFLDEDGEILKWKVGYDQWEGAFARYMNLGATRRNTQLVLSDITDIGY